MTAVLAPGPPPLTDDASSAAIDLVDFIAAAVYGVDRIDVTDSVRAAWSQLLAESYQTLPPPMRMWFAAAPETLSITRAQFPMLGDVPRAVVLQQWTAQLPWLVQMIAPAFHAAQAPMTSAMTDDEATVSRLMRDIEAEKGRLAGMAQPAWTADPVPSTTAATSDAEAIAALNRMNAFNVGIQNGTTAMTSSTIGLMHAMSPNWPGHDS